MATSTTISPVPGHEPASVSELIELSRQNPMRWLVPNLVLENGVHVLHGSEESFKTMLTLQLHEALTTGGRILLRQAVAGLRTGIAELESKNQIFSHRLRKFFPNGAPDIRVLPESLRRKLLGGSLPKDRIAIIADWAESEKLDFVSIDSAVKLFPVGCDLSKADIASEVFNQLQRLPTVWIIAHDRKQQPGITSKGGNAEIVGSGRFAQDPDVIHQMSRNDGRAPVVVFSWGKMREGEKFPNITLYFDRVDYRLYPLHPYLHLLGERPVLGTHLVTEAEHRYGWKERRAREHLSTFPRVLDAAGNPCVEETMNGHSKQYQLVGTPASLSYNPGELVQGCSNSMALEKPAPIVTTAVETVPSGEHVAEPTKVRAISISEFYDESVEAG